MSVVDFAWETAWEPPPPVPEPQPRVNGRAVIRRWLAVTTVLAAVGCGGWLAVLHYETHVAGEQALAAAESYVLRLTDIDADNVDANLAGIADGSTGEFQGRHAHSGARLRQALVDSNASARGHVTEGLIKSATRNQVVVVLLVNQAVRNADNPQPVIDRSRIRMTMDRVGGRWLASRVELL